MLEKITLRFQCHDETNVSFDPLVTTITGVSDCGKSSLLRAILWVATNKPTGTDFIPWGRKTAHACLTVDGQRITRHRGEGRNDYRLNKKVFKAFGQGVPEEIAALLNFSEVNYQGQHQGPYWFMKTAGEVARELNSIVNLHLIDETLACLASELRKTRIEVDVTRRRLDDAKKQRKELRWVKDCQRDYTACEQLYTQYQLEHEKSLALSSLVSKIESLSEQLQERESLNLAWETLSQKIERKQSVAEQRNKLSSLIREIESCQKDLQRVKTSSMHLEEQLAKVKKCPLCQQSMT